MRESRELTDLLGDSQIEQSSWRERARAVLRSLRTPLAIDAGRTLLANVGIAVLTVCAGVLQARLLGPVGRGELAAIQAWPSMFAAFAMLGIQDSIVFFGARDPERSGEYAVSGTAVILVCAMPLMVMFWAALPTVMSAASPRALNASRWYLGLVFVFVISGLAVSLLRAIHATRAWNIVRLSTPCGWVGLLLLASAWGINRPDVIAKAFLVMSGLLALVFVWSVRSNLRGHWRPDWRVGWKMLLYGVPVMAGSLPQVLNQRADQLVVVNYLDARQLGYYAVAMSWASAVGIASSAVASVTFPRVSAVTDPASRLALGGKAVRATLLLAGTAALVLGWGTNALFPRVFGSAFAPAIPIAMLLLAATFIRAINDTMEAVLKGSGRTRAVMWSEICGMALLIPALAMLVPRFGLRGAGVAAIAGAVASCAMSCLALLLEHRRCSRLLPLLDRASA